MVLGGGGFGGVLAARRAGNPGPEARVSGPRRGRKSGPPAEPGLGAYPFFSLPPFLQLFPPLFYPFFKVPRPTSKSDRLLKDPEIGLPGRISAGF